MMNYKMKKAALLTSVFAMGTVLAGCQEYLVRSDLVSPYAGNAVATNASNQTIDPWPIYVNDTDYTKHDEAPVIPGQIQITSAPAQQ